MLQLDYQKMVNIIIKGKATGNRWWLINSNLEKAQIHTNDKVIYKYRNSSSPEKALSSIDRIKAAFNILFYMSKSIRKNMIDQELEYYKI